MVDSFVFRVHNLTLHYPSIINFHQSQTGRETLETKSQIKAKKMERRVWLHDFRNEIMIPLRYSDKRKVASSNHDIAFTIEWNADYLEANVSIPKMIFGTNVCELVIPPGHKDYTVNNTSPYHHINFAWDMIKQTVKKVLGAVAHGNFIEIEWTDIEIMRIDMCVNQHFESKHEALRYLNHQKGLHKKHSRISGGASNTAEWKTSITFKTKYYYAKIYHKGSEFEQKQQKAIIEINKDRKKKGLLQLSSNINYAATHIKDLQEYSDKILRYELEFRKTYLQYLFNNRINKQWSADWKRCLTVYNYFSGNEDLRRDIFKYEVRYINENGIESKERPVLVRHINLYHKRYNGDKKKFEYTPFKFKEQQMLQTLRMLGYTNERDFKVWFKKMTKELTRSRDLKVKLLYNYPDYTNSFSVIDGRKVGNDVLNGITPNDVRFTKSLMVVMVQELSKFFRQFQIVSKQPESVLEDKITAYNQRIHHQVDIALLDIEKKRLRKTLISDHQKRSLLQYHMLHSKFNQKQLVPKHFSRTTHHRISKLYAKISGQKYQIAHSNFSNIIERNFDSIYEKLFSDMQFSFLTNFYNKSPHFLGTIK